MRGAVSVKNGKTVTTPGISDLVQQGTMLKAMVGSLRSLSRATEIVVHDNGSTDADTLDVLRGLGTAGVRVVRCGSICDPEQLNEVDRTISSFFRRERSGGDTS